MNYYKGNGEDWTGGSSRSFPSTACFVLLKVYGIFYCTLYHKYVLCCLFKVYKSCHTGLKLRGRDNLWRIGSYFFKFWVTVMWKTDFPCKSPKGNLRSNSGPSQGRDCSFCKETYCNICTIWCSPSVCQTSHTPELAQSAHKHMRQV